MDAVGCGSPSATLRIDTINPKCRMKNRGILHLQQISAHSPMIAVTPHAVRELHVLLEGKTDATAGAAPGLRLLVQKGGCAGFQYAMKIDHARPGDTIIGEAGVQVFVDPESLPYLDGSVLEYHDGLTDSGFKITNPNAARSCGCGSSFEPAAPPVAPPPPADPNASAMPCPSEAD